MKKIVESEARKIRRRTNIQHVLLHTVGAAGMLSVALLAPNALQILSVFDGGKIRRQNPKYLFGTSIEKLCAKGMLRFEQAEHGKYVRLTEKGQHELARMVARRPDARKHKRWDGRFRMVAYDIREKRRYVRVKLQEILQAFGFYKLQNSVWIYPYDCEALVILLKADFRIGTEVLYAVVEKIENDRKIKDHFGLK